MTTSHEEREQDAGHGHWGDEDLNAQSQASRDQMSSPRKRAYTAGTPQSSSKKQRPQRGGPVCRNATEASPSRPGRHALVQNHSNASAGGYSRQHNGDHHGNITTTYSGDLIESQNGRDQTNNGVQSVNVIVQQADTREKAVKQNEIVFMHLWYDGMNDWKTDRAVKPPLHAWEWIYTSDPDQATFEGPSRDSQLSTVGSQAVRSNLAEQAARRLCEWLRSSSDSFYLSGEERTGKSTLMEFLSTHPKTTELLQQWAGPHDDVLIASFFAKKDGIPRGKNLSGLLRCLLRQLFLHKPSLIGESIPIRWRDITPKEASTKPWDFEELRATFRSVLRQRNTRFVFFVDALDEFEDDHQLIIEELQYINRQATAKVCVSSRPISPFHAAFGQAPGCRWVLQRLVRTGTFSSVPEVRAIAMDEPALENDEAAGQRPDEISEDAEEGDDGESHANGESTQQTQQTVTMENSHASQNDTNMIDLTIPGNELYLVKRFNKWVKHSEVFSRLRKNYADTFDRYSSQCIPHQELTHRLGEVAATIRTSDLAHILGREKAWSVFLQMAEKKIKAENQQAVRFQKNVVRAEGKALVDGLVATTTMRVAVLKDAKERHDKLVAELKDWADAVEKDEEQNDAE